MEVGRESGRVGLFEWVDCSSRIDFIGYVGIRGLEIIDNRGLRFRVI